MRHYHVRTQTAAFLAVALMALATTGLGHIANAARAVSAVQKPIGIRPADASKGSISRPATAKSLPVAQKTETSLSPPLTAQPAASSTSYQILWQSINAGGTMNGVSPSYKMKSSVGQPVVGKASSPSYAMGTGFWYGVAGGCNCPHQGDMQLPNGSGFIDVSDVLKVIGVAFTNGADVTDPGCPKSRGDVNNTGFVDVNDVLYIIKTAFTNGPPPVNPCGP